MHWMIDRFCLFFIFENWKLQKVVLSYLSVGIGVLTGKAKVEHVDPSHRLQRFLLSNICSALTFIMPWSEIFPLNYYSTCMLWLNKFVFKFTSHYLPEEFCPRRSCLVSHLWWRQHQVCHQSCRDNYNHHQPINHCKWRFIRNIFLFFLIDVYGLPVQEAHVMDWLDPSKNLKSQPGEQYYNSLFHFKQGIDLSWRK